MSDLWLLIDCDCLCHRAFHTKARELTHKGRPTGVIYGFFNQVMAIQQRFRTHRIAFCFDDGDPHRLAVMPTYKESRHKRVVPKDEAKQRKSLHRQIEDLKHDILPSIGFRNVLFSAGYEADDIIASVVYKECYGKSADIKAAIVSADQDLYQLLLNGRIAQYNPGNKQLETAQSVYNKWRVRPEEWAMFKAIVGCSTDDVRGVEGIGPKKAAQYIRGDLKSSGKIKAVIEQARELIELNLKVVDLPYDFTPEFNLRPDKITREKWKRVATSLGFESMPIPTYKRILA